MRPAAVTTLHGQKSNLRGWNFVQIFKYHCIPPIDVEHIKFSKPPSLGDTIFTFESFYSLLVRIPSRFTCRVFLVLNQILSLRTWYFPPRSWVLSPLRGFLTGSTLSLFHYYTRLETFLHFQKHPFKRMLLTSTCLFLCIGGHIKRFTPLAVTPMFGDFCFVNVCFLFFFFGFACLVSH